MEKIVGFFEASIAPLCLNVQIPGCYCMREGDAGRQLTGEQFGGDSANQGHLTAEDAGPGVRKVRRGSGRQIQ